MEKVQKSEQEWRTELSPEEYSVLREKGTERAFTGAYWDNKGEGIYRCKGCGTELFSSDAKFDSGTGWPSFYAPADQENIATEEDRSFFMKPHRGQLQPLRRPSRTRLRGRPGPHRPALLHQQLLAGLRPQRVSAYWR